MFNCFSIRIMAANLNDSGTWHKLKHKFRHLVQDSRSYGGTETDK